MNKQTESSVPINSEIEEGFRLTARSLRWRRSAPRVFQELFAEPVETSVGHDSILVLILGPVRGSSFRHHRRADPQQRRAQCVHARFRRRSDRTRVDPVVVRHLRVPILIRLMGTARRSARAGPGRAGVRAARGWRRPAQRACGSAISRVTASVLSPIALATEPSRTRTRAASRAPRARACRNDLRARARCPRTVRRSSRSRACRPCRSSVRR